MKLFMLLVICAVSALAIPTPLADAEQCDEAKCKRANDCACASQNSPIDTDKTPQFITITIDDSLRDDIYDNYIVPLLNNRKNPDGKPITATFYVPHQYTTYEKINNLYNQGHDIGVNSISKDVADYWANAGVEQLTKEFDGQKKIVSEYANIPLDDIQGARTPHFQLNGDETFKAYKSARLSYDNSYPVLSSTPLFPFTLEYKLTYPCQVGKCPKESHSKMWVMPIVNLRGGEDRDCNVLASCDLNLTATGTRDWLIEQYNRHHEGNRAPMNLLVTSQWFGNEPYSFEGLKLFLEYIGTKSDTYLVSHREVISWARNPTVLTSYKTTHTIKNQACKAKTCALPFGEHEIRYMRCCVEKCPDEYPWLQSSSRRVA